MLATSQLIGVRQLCKQTRGIASLTRHNRCAWMSVTPLGESTPLKFAKPFPGVEAAYIVDDAPDLATWRKQQEEAGTPDPFWMLTPKERNAWVDDIENRHYNPTMSTPMGFRYSPKHPYSGAYGRFDWHDWPDNPLTSGFTFELTSRRLLYHHPEVIKRESIGWLWILTVAVYWNYTYAEEDRERQETKAYYLSRGSADHAAGVNFGRQVGDDA